MNLDMFNYKKANFNKLKQYGFVEINGIFQYETFIFDNQFKMFVYVTKDEKISTKVVDQISNEEYILHLIGGSVGEFVGNVRTEFERVLNDICDKCFETNVFKSKQASEIMNYIDFKYGNKLEFLWEKFSNNAICRRSDNSKWYGVFAALQKNKIGLAGNEIIDIAVLRAEPDTIKTLIDNKHFFVGYHMNKTNWLTVYLDSGVPIEKIFELIDKSYELAAKK